MSRKLSTYGPSLVVLGTAIVVLLVGPSAVWRLTYAHTRAQIVQAAEGLAGNSILEQLDQAYRDIATLVEPSVVHIGTDRTVTTRFGDERRLSSTGSGWIYDESGHIVTNYHVIEGAERIEVQLHDGELREARIVGFDQFTDIALIKVEPGRLIPALRAPAGEAELVKQGDLVFAFGSPFDFRFSMSSGVVSGIGRYVGVIRDDRGRLTGYENFIQVDAAINPGNSGGPLTDARGRVIGMNTAIATSGRREIDEGQFAGIGLAIPIEMIDPVAQQIIGTGSVQKGFLGVSVVDRSQSVGFAVEILQFRGYGLVTARLDPGSPAHDAGLRMGDVITEVQGRPVSSLAQLSEETIDLPPDDPVELTVWRFDSTSNTSSVLRVKVPGVVAATGFRGVWLIQLDDDIETWLNLLGFTGRGVRIAKLEAAGPAGKAGLRLGDVITHVNDQPVGSVSQLRSMISSMLPGRVARLKLWRYEPKLDQGRDLTFEVPLDRLDIVQSEGLIPPDREAEGIERLGIGQMSTATPALADELGVRFTPGVILEEIIAGSQLDGRAEPGSIIVAVMDRSVTDVSQFFRELSKHDLRREAGVRVTFIHPDGTSDQVVLTVR